VIIIVIVNVLMLTFLS